VATPLVDTHCHLDDAELFGDVDAIMADARKAGIRWCITIGAGRGIDSAHNATALAHTYEEVVACVGIHPYDASCATDEVMKTLAWLANDPRVVGVGETGLDQRPGTPPRELQHDAFRRCIDLAKASGKPLVVHTRNAADDTLSILKSEGARQSGGVIHSCTESVAFVKACLDMNFDISLSPLLRDLPHATALAQYVPRDRLVIETSAPYHAPPTTLRNEPKCLPIVAEHVSSVMGVRIDDLFMWTSANAIKRFGLDEVPVASRRSVV
jgi:TatD DNase family protein